MGSMILNHVVQYMKTEGRMQGRRGEGCARYSSDFRCLLDRVDRSAVVLVLVGLQGLGRWLGATILPTTRLPRERRGDPDEQIDHHEPKYAKAYEHCTCDAACLPFPECALELRGELARAAGASRRNRSGIARVSHRPQLGGP